MKYKILSLLNENDFISGEKMAEELNVSRAAVWKNINKLKSDGYKIQSSTKKGYRLIKDKYPYNQYEIAKNLDNKLIASKLIFCDETDSTNDEIKRIVNNGVINGLCVVADTQTKGKGRMGRTWQSPKETGIYFSVCLVPDITPMEAPQITLMAGAAVCSAINEYLSVSAKIKWPNDIILNGKKVCGILTEISAEIDIIKYIVCGIGINVNTDFFPNELKEKASSLKAETGKEINRAELLGEILKKLEFYYKIFLSSKGISAFLEEYKSLCANIGSSCTAIAKGEKISGIVCDIDKNGNIIIEKENGERISIFSGEVSLRRSDGSYI